VRLWSLADGTATERAVLEVGCTPYGICFSADGALVAVGDENSGASVFNVAEAALVCRVGEGDTEVLRPAFHPAGDEIVVGDLGGRLRVYRLADAACVLERTFASGVSAVRFTDGAVWVVATDGWIRRWPLAADASANARSAAAPTPLAGA
jgi:WD40 repeat protein